MTIGGPALAHRQDFFGRFLDYVKERSLRLDFISVHNYGVMPEELNDRSKFITVANNVKRQGKYARTIREHGFEGTRVVVDEWGFSTGGFLNREECPSLMFRETEKFASYYVKLIHECIKNDFHLSTLMICLSGQHEMVEDFTGFRNFFTLNFIAKPIYNAHIMASRLGDGLLSAEVENADLHVIPTKKENGDYAVLLTYASEYFDEGLPTLAEKLTFSENVSGRDAEIYCIDKTHTNPYAMALEGNMLLPTEEQLDALRSEGILKPIYTGKADELELTLTANSTYLITVKGI